MLIAPRVFPDSRGYFLETYHRDKIREGGTPEPFGQANQPYSVHGVLRGLHAQLRRPQG